MLVLEGASLNKVPPRARSNSKQNVFVIRDYFIGASMITFFSFKGSVTGHNIVGGVQDFKLVYNI